MAVSKKPPMFNPLPEDAVLDEAELQAVQEEAQQTVLKEEKKRARERALQRAIRAERAKVDPNEELVEYRIDLPVYAADIRLDNVIYLNGAVYKIPRSKLAAILEITQQAQINESQIIRPGARRSYQAMMPNIYNEVPGLTMSGRMY